MKNNLDRRVIFADIIVILIVVQYVIETGILLSQGYTIIGGAVIILVAIALLMQINFIGEIVSIFAIFLFLMKMPPLDHTGIRRGQVHLAELLEHGIVLTEYFHQTTPLVGDHTQWFELHTVYHMGFPFFN